MLLLLASSQSVASEEVDCCRSEGRHRLKFAVEKSLWDLNFHLKEGVRRMRLRGREDMVVVDREEEGEGVF